MLASALAAHVSSAKQRPPSVIHEEVEHLRLPATLRFSSGSHAQVGLQQAAPGATVELIWSSVDLAEDIDAVAHPSIASAGETTSGRGERRHSCSLTGERQARLLIASGRVEIDPASG